MKIKKIILRDITKTKCISVILAFAMLVCGVTGCALPYFDVSMDNSITREEVQSDLDELLKPLSHYKDLSSDKSQSEILKKEKVNVENEIRLGDITVWKPGNETSLPETFNILEIVPRKDCSVLQYMVGGYEPLDKYGLDAAINREVGITLKEDGTVEKYYTDEGYRHEADKSECAIANNSQLFGNSSTNSNFSWAYVTRSGYMKKIDPYRLRDADRKLVGGTYALKRNNPGRRELAFVSEYSAAASQYGDGEFCWVWEDLTDTGNFDSTFYDFYNFSFPDKYDTFIDENTKEVRIPSWIDKVFIRDVQKYKIYNNEMFLLYCMGVVDYETDDYSLVGSGMGPDATKLEKLSEFYDGEGSSIYKDCLDSDKLEDLKSTGKFHIDTLAPEELKDFPDIVDNANLFIFAAQDGGLYNKARKVINVECEDKLSDGVNDYLGDIQMSDFVRIYDRIINNKAASVWARSAVSTSKPKIKNLGFILHKIANTKIAYDPSDYKYYSKFSNPYAIQEDAESKYSNGENRYFSGRVLFTDFISDFVDNGKAYSSYNGLKQDCKVVTSDGINYSRPIDYVKVLDDGRIFVNIGSGIYYENWEDAFKQNNVSFPFVEGDTVKNPDNIQNYNLSFLHNDYYYNQGFGIRNGYPNDGRYVQYANQLVITDDSSFLTYGESEGGLRFVKAIVNSLYPPPKTSPLNELIGTIDFMGGGEILSDKRSAEYSHTYADADMAYHNKVDEYKSNTGEMKKVIYINDVDLANAKNEGFDLHCLVYSKLDPYSPDTKIKMENDKSKIAAIEGVLGGKKYKYKSDVTYIGEDSSPKDYYVYLYTFHIPKEYFNDSNIEINDDDGMFTVKIDIPYNTSLSLNADGKDEIRIVIRDEYDLD